MVIGDLHEGMDHVIQRWPCKDVSSCFRIVVAIWNAMFPQDCKRASERDLPKSYPSWKQKIQTFNIMSNEMSIDYGVEAIVVDE